MCYLTAVLAGLLGAPLVQLPAVRTSGPEPELTFTQDGKDLVVSMTVEVPDAQSLAWPPRRLSIVV
jgi:hypothetical protein